MQSNHEISQPSQYYPSAYIRFILNVWSNFLVHIAKLGVITFKLSRVILLVESPKTCQGYTLSNIIFDKYHIDGTQSIKHMLIRSSMCALGWFLQQNQIGVGISNEMTYKVESQILSDLWGGFCNFPLFFSEKRGGERNAELIPAQKWPKIAYPAQVQPNTLLWCTRRTPHHSAKARVCSRRGARGSQVLASSSPWRDRRWRRGAADRAPLSLSLSLPSSGSIIHRRHRRSALLIDLRRLEVGSPPQASDRFKPQ